MLFRSDQMIQSIKKLGLPDDDYVRLKSHFQEAILPGHRRGMFLHQLGWRHFVVITFRVAEVFELAGDFGQGGFELHDTGGGSFRVRP